MERERCLILRRANRDDATNADKEEESKRSRRDTGRRNLGALVLDSWPLAQVTQSPAGLSAITLLKCPTIWGHHENVPCRFSACSSSKAKENG